MIDEDKFEQALTSAVAGMPACPDEDGHKAWGTYSRTLAELSVEGLHERRVWLYRTIRERHFEGAGNKRANPHFDVEHTMLNIIAKELGRRERERSS